MHNRGKVDYFLMNDPNHGNAQPFGDLLYMHSLKLGGDPGVQPAEGTRITISKYLVVRLVKLL